MSFIAATTWHDNETIITQDWLQGRGAFGGLITAAALRSATSLVPHLPVRSVTTRFLAPLRPGPARRDAAVLTSGKAVTTVRARIHSADALAAEVDVVFGPPRASTLIVPGPRSPDSSPPGHGMVVPYIPHVTPAFLQHVDLDLLDGGLPYSGGTDPSTGGWCRWRDDASDLAGQVALIDAWPPAVITLGRGPFPSATVAWTVHLTGRPALDPWHRFRATTVSAGDGFASTVGHLWRSDGELVAWSEQLVAVFDA